MLYKRLDGFTLVELLIGLAILGVIATFTIPKILQAQQEQQSQAVTKEIVGAMSQALEQLRLSGQLNQYTNIVDLEPYLNYVSILPSGSLDGLYDNAGGLTIDCADYDCLKMHNGAVIILTKPDGGPTTGNYFGGTTARNYIYYYVDPDGVLTSPTDENGPGRSVHFSLYYNGRTMDYANCAAPDVTYLWGTPQSFCPGLTSPPWFSWER